MHYYKIICLQCIIMQHYQVFSHMLQNVSVGCILCITIKSCHVWCQMSRMVSRFVGALKLQVSFAEHRLFYRALLQKKPDSLLPNHVTYGTGWRRCIGCLKLQVVFRKRATNYKTLLRKITYHDKVPYRSSPPCTCVGCIITCHYAIIYVRCIIMHYYKITMCHIWCKRTQHYEIVSYMVHV